jgi:probable rRNA maturation factor
MEINVLIDKQFKGKLDVEWLQSVATQVLIAQYTETNVEMGILITSQDKVRQLNRIYRNLDEPTDVLAFYMLPELPVGEPAPESFATPPDGILHVGEVVISYPQVVAQALESRHSVERETAILLIHGVLHLLGYDHNDPEGERLIKTREAEILGRIERFLK